jgi:outer membrane lipoprotein-sorting protein
MKTKKRVIIVAFLIVLLVASAGLVAATMILSADELLTRSLETLETITSGHAVVEATVDLPDQSLSSTFEIWGKLDAGPDGEPAFRMEMQEVSESEMAGVIAVTDGSQFWLYSPDRETVVVGTAKQLAPILAERLAEYAAEYAGEWDRGGEYSLENMEEHDNPADAVAKLLEYFTAERVGKESIGSNEAYRLRLVPIAEKMPVEFRAVGGFVNLWLRTSDQLPLAAEYAESALGYARIQATSVEINTDLDDALFTFVIPEGTEVIRAGDLLTEFDKMGLPEASVDLDFLTPGQLPQEAVAAEPQQIAGAVVQRFNMPGDQSFVIAQGAAMPLDPPEGAAAPEDVMVRGVEGALYTNSEATRTLLAWSEGEIFFLIGGDLSPEQALAIAESLQ